MSECNWCGRDPELEEILGIDDYGHNIIMKGHACHCSYDDHIRIAVGICCGRDLGEKLLAEEDASDERWAQRNKDV